MVTYSSILAWKNSIHRVAWQATVHGVTKSRTWLRDWAHAPLLDCKACRAGITSSFTFCPTVANHPQTFHSGEPVYHRFVPRKWILGGNSGCRMFVRKFPGGWPLEEGRRVMEPKIERKDWSQTQAWGQPQLRPGGALELEWPQKLGSQVEMMGVYTQALSFTDRGHLGRGVLGQDDFGYKATSGGQSKVVCCLCCSWVRN